MVKEPAIITACDGCGSDSGVHEVEISIDGELTLADLCDTCLTPVRAAFPERRVTPGSDDELWLKFLERQRADRRR